MARKKVTYESMVDQAKQKIQEKPQRVMPIIGQFLVKRVRAKAMKSRNTRIYFRNGRAIKVRPGRLKRSIGYWYRKKEKDLQIGSKAFYAHWVEKGSSMNSRNPFLEPTVEAEINTIQEMIATAMREL